MTLAADYLIFGLLTLLLVSLTPGFAATARAHSRPAVIGSLCAVAQGWPVFLVLVALRMARRRF